ncbi:peptidase P60 [Rhizobium sp. Leaf371]|nr:NlpC/P60 family protein [Rhizobium sp. PP-F2F-G48]KQS68143.1 peptidase P60 [Rhizobium sp. Leaf371]
MRLRVLASARDWIGTPYRHQASLKGVGCDCLGLIRGIWREIHGREPETPPPYRPDWAERSGEDRLWDAATRVMGAPIDLGAMRPGDLLLFRWRLGMPAKHAGILSRDEAPPASGGARFIHAYEQASVVESALVPAWRRRIAGVFRFPEVF